MTTLTKGADVLNLPDDFIWADEFDFNPVAANASYGIDGSLFIDEGVRLAGQPMTLDGSHLWVPRSTVITLQAWRALPNQTFTLNYRGANHTVRMDHARGAFAASPVTAYGDPESTDDYTLTLRFLKV